jgi:hypothetical protein
MGKTRNAYRMFEKPEGIFPYKERMKLRWVHNIKIWLSEMGEGSMVWTGRVQVETGGRFVRTQERSLGFRKISGCFPHLHN